MCRKQNHEKTHSLLPSENCTREIKDARKTLFEALRIVERN